MATTQQVELLLPTLYDARGIGYPPSPYDADVQFWEENTIAGIAPTGEGYGSPVFVGRNRHLDLVLAIDAVEAAGTLDVTVQTAASAQARHWRTLGTYAQQTVAGSVSLSLDGAQDWVRVRYALSAGAAFAASVAGDASLVLRPAGAVVASGASTPVDLAQYRSARLVLDCSAITVAAQHSVTVALETAPSPTSATWTTVATQALTVPATVELAAVSLERYLRARWTVAAGDSATFGLAGTTSLVLATPADRARLGIGAAVFPTMTAGQADDWMRAGTAAVMTAIGGRYCRPLRAWDDEVRRACIAAADWLAITGRGTEPGVAIDPKLTSYYERYAYYFGTLDAPGSGWLARVAGRKLDPDITDSSTPEVSGERRSLAVSSAPLRGWGGPRGRSARGGSEGP